MWVTEFRITHGTELFIGPVHQGDFVDPRLTDPRHGAQVFIEKPLHDKVLEVETTRLVDDTGNLHVLPGSRRTQ